MTAFPSPFPLVRLERSFHISTCNHDLRLPGTERQCHGSWVVIVIKCRAGKVPERLAIDIRQGQCLVDCDNGSGALFPQLTT